MTDVSSFGFPIRRPGVAFSEKADRRPGERDDRMPATSSSNVPAAPDRWRLLLNRWRDDPRGSYTTWFLWEERLKNFRSIRRGIEVVVSEIEAGTFGNVYKGSSLETVVGSVAEQRQIFRGADHAFLWKPKLRIPDIYENRENQLGFARFLHACACCNEEERIIEAIHRLNSLQIKGLGPAVANLLYFLHPTLAPPSNTAIVRGFNLVTGGRVKLGRWDDYLAMRKGILAFNQRFRDCLSNDLGAAAAFFFDIGNDRYPLPPRDETQISRWEADLAAVREEADHEARTLSVARESDRTHTEIQGWLRDLGLALGFHVWVASNDHRRPFAGGVLGDRCVAALPARVETSEAIEAIRLIDVLWIDAGGESVAAAFEVEHSTSIYSGIVRMLDLALGSADQLAGRLFLVAPDDREDEVRRQLLRPAFYRVRDLNVRFLPYGQLENHREDMARFGEGLKAVVAVAKSLL
jgi:type II restriction enzyme